MILHISPNVVFIHQFIGFVEKSFSELEMKYVIFQKDQKKRLPENSKVQKLNYSLTKIGFASLISLIRDINKADRIVLHGLNEAMTFLLLFLMPWNLKKSYWFTWGDDVYKEVLKNSLKLKLLSFFKKFVVRNLGFIVVEIDGEYENINKFFNPRGERIKSFKYPSNIFTSTITEGINQDSLNILVGNSSDPGNCHLEMFRALKEELAKKGLQNYNIVCPLSYGSDDHAEKVIKKGELLFGSNFMPLTNFLPLDEYQKMLSSLDIALFNHRRQQAMGNIINLIGLGKKVFIRKEVTTWDYFEQLNIKVYCTSELELERVTEDIANKNSEIVKAYFSKEKLQSDLKQVFTA
ncbi:MAG TPA: hypothetical protein DEO59_02795 [Balneola sp.]|nr:hypothetical protein [Balneola sp.]MAO78659.1 hypothetical protein [Balneola sp.]MBF63113.1 hypothetical protein [Balneola sp.]HAW79865.1 hypothetical protein [Balneola sp.]HBZ37434.1 hypothetical protein [Balneola sp.]